MTILVMCECGHSNEDHDGGYGLCWEMYENGMTCDCEGFDPEDA